MGSGVKNNTFQVCRAQAATVHVASDVIVTRRCRANDRFHEIARARVPRSKERVHARRKPASKRSHPRPNSQGRCTGSNRACLHLTRARNFHRRAPFTPILLFPSSASFSALHHSSLSFFLFDHFPPSFSSLLSFSTFLSPFAPFFLDLFSSIPLLFLFLFLLCFLFFFDFLSFFFFWIGILIRIGWSIIENVIEREIWCVRYIEDDWNERNRTRQYVL